MPNSSNELDINIQHAESKSENTSENVKPLPTRNRPWIRFFARYIDIYLCGFIFCIIWNIASPESLPKSNIILGLIILFIWMFMEAILLSTWGTTLGKWLLNIQLTDANSKKLVFSKALNRSFKVWIYGLALGLPIISLFTLISAYSDLTKRGATSWDKEGNFIIIHNKISILKGTITILIFIAFLALSFYGQIATQL